MKKFILILMMAFIANMVLIAQENQSDEEEVMSEQTEITSMDDLDGGLFQVDLIGNSGMTEKEGFGLLQTSMKDMATKTLLISLIAIIAVFGMPIFIILIVFIFKYKEKKRKYKLAEQALAAGKEIPVEFFSPGVKSENSKNKGITNSFLGLGLAILLWALTGRFALACVGFMIMLIGIGQIVIYYTSRNEKDKYDRGDRGGNYQGYKKKENNEVVEIIEKDYTDSNTAE